MWRSLSFILYVGSSSVLDFPQIGFCFVLAPIESAEVSIGGVVRCCTGGGLLINGLIMLATGIDYMSDLLLQLSNLPG